MNKVSVGRGVYRARLPLLMLASFNIYILIQIIPPTFIPAFLIPDFLTAAYNAAYQSVPRLTVDLQASLDSGMQSYSLFFTALLTVLLAQSRRRIKLILTVIMFAGFIQAFYGSLMLLSGIEYGFLEYKTLGTGLATGTYINRNHFANLVVMSLSAGIGLLICKMDLDGALSWRHRIIAIIKAVMGEKGRLRIYLVIMVIALVLTRSRMGNTSFFIALLLTGILTLILMKKPSRPLVIFVVSLIFVDIFLVGTWFGIEQVVDRINETVEVRGEEWVIHAKDRLDANRETIEIIKEAPIFGTGGGTFYSVFPAWREVDQSLFDNTHNDYLQIVAEYGLIGLIFLISFLVSVIHKTVSFLRNPADITRFGVSFAVLLAVFAMLIHISVEFNFQIYANAAYFVILCVLPFCLSRRSNQ